METRPASKAAQLAMVKKIRRFGVRPVESGPFEGSLHIASNSYQRFWGELLYFHNFLNRRLLPMEPEDVEMRGIILNLQNLLENEAEELICHYVEQQGGNKGQQFQQQIENGFISFRAKYDWLLARRLIDQGAWGVMDEVRRLRNDHVHARPTPTRNRFRYRGFPLLTKRSVRKLFVDVELTLRALRRASGRTSKWQVVPPGYASEMGWPSEYIEALEGKDSKQQV